MQNSINKERNNGTPVEKDGCLTYSKLAPEDELEPGKTVIEYFSREYENRFKDLKYCYENLKPEHIKDNPRAYDVTIPKGGNAEPLFMCSACYHYLKDHEERMFIKGYVYSYVYITDVFNSSRLTQITFINNDNVNEKEVEKYFFKNLKKFEV